MTRQYHTIPRRSSRTVPPASRHRAGHYAGLHPEDDPRTTRRYVSQDEDDDLTLVEEDEDAGQIVPRSALPLRDVPRRSMAHTAPRDIILHRVPRRASAFVEQETEEVTRPRRRPHGLLIVGLIMLAILIGYLLLTWLFAWVQNERDTLTYGYPRTYQCDAVVGHSDSEVNPSHFIALNLNARIEVIEFPGGDASHAKIYVGPTLIGPNAALAPVTLRFADVTGKGKLDMLIQVQGSTFVFLNTGTQFRPATPNDHVTLPNP